MSEKCKYGDVHLDVCKCLEDSKSELTRLREERDRYRKALESIAANSCCKPCREAGLWAKAALSDVGSEGEKA